MHQVRKHVSQHGTSTRELRLFTHAPMATNKANFKDASARVRSRREELWKELAPPDACQPVAAGQEVHFGSNIYLYTCTRCHRTANFSHLTACRCKADGRAHRGQPLTLDAIMAGKKIVEVNSSINSILREEHLTRRKSLCREHRRRSSTTVLC